MGLEAEEGAVEERDAGFLAFEEAFLPGAVDEGDFFGGMLGARGGIVMGDDLVGAQWSGDLDFEFGGFED